MKIEHVAVALGHYSHPLCYQTTVTMGLLVVLLAIGQHSSWPLPQATNCQGVTVSHPTQPLVSTAVGPSHKQPTVKEWPLVRCPGNHLSQSQPISGSAQLWGGPRPHPPHPQTTNCQGVTVSGPARLLVSAAVGLPTNNQLSRSNRWWGDSGKNLWSGSWQVESELKGRALSSPQGLSSSPGLEWVVSWGPREQAGDYVLKGFRAPAKAAYWPAQGLEVAVNLFPIPTSVASQLSFWDTVYGTCPCHMRAWRAQGSAGSWVPGSLNNDDDGWAGSGNLALRKPPAEVCLLLARTGTWRVEVMPGDLTLSCQNRE